MRKFLGASWALLAALGNSSTKVIPLKPGEKVAF